MLSEQALNKRNWEGKEDVVLLELHAAYGPNWTRIAGGMGIRSAKQCRERYTQHLKPGLNRSPISDDEGRQIMRMVGESGQRWAQIARSLGTNRSDNQIKNWWNGAKRKETSKRQESSSPQDHHHHHQQQQQQQQSPYHHAPPSPATSPPSFSALPERRGILPPVPLDLPFRPDSSTAAFEAAAARSRASPARCSYDSDRPPSLVSDSGSSWSSSSASSSLSSQPASAACSPTTFSLPPLLFAPPTPPPQQVGSSSSCLPPPAVCESGFGPVRRSSEVLHYSSGYYSPRGRAVNTAPTTPIGSGSGRASARWEPYARSGRRPSTGYLREAERGGKGSVSFLLN